MKKIVIVAVTMFVASTFTSTARSEPNLEWEGKWSIYTDTDIMFNNENIIIGLNSNDDKEAEIAFGCVSNHSYFSFHPPSPFIYSLADSTASVIYKIDNNDPVDSAWRISSNRESSNLLKDEAIKFLKKLYNAKKLILRTFGAYGIPTNTFDLTGIKPQIDKIATHCNWKISE